MFAAIDTDGRVHIVSDQGDFGDNEADSFTWYGLPDDFDSRVSSAVLIDGEIVVLSVDEARQIEYNNTLRIAEYLPGGADPLTTDFTLLPLRKPNSQYDCGRKVSSVYLNDEGEIVVRKTFFDMTNSDDALVGIFVLFEWFTNDGYVGLYKQQIVKEYTGAEADIVVERRQEIVVRESV